MSISFEAVEKLLQDAGIKPGTDIGEDQTAFSYLEGCIMGALDEIADRADSMEKEDTQ